MKPSKYFISVKDFACFCPKWYLLLVAMYPEGVDVMKEKEWILRKATGFDICYACYSLLGSRYKKFKQANHFIGAVNFNRTPQKKAFDLLKYVLVNKKLPRTKLKGLPLLNG